MGDVKHVSLRDDGEKFFLVGDDGNYERGKWRGDYQDNQTLHSDAHLIRGINPR